MKLYLYAILLIFTALLTSLGVDGQVVAGFTANTYSGCPTLLVSFTNTTTGAAGYIWDLDNGSPAIDSTNIRGSYPASGVYTVTLTAYNGADTQKVSHIITVFPVPVVAFSANDTAVCPWAPVTFTSTSAGGVPGPLLSSWSFDDGFTGAGSTVMHTFSLPDYYSIILTVTNADGCVNSAAKPNYIHIYTPARPVVSADTSICHAPAAVDFTDAVTGTPPFTYAWTFGDMATSTVSNPVHTYTSAGQDTVTLIVGDGHGCKDTVVLPDYIHIGNVFASFSYPDTACINTPVTFYNTTNAYTSAGWIFGNGRTSSSDSSGTDTFSVAGPYTVLLTIRDSFCMDTVSHVIYIHPGPAASFTQNPANPCPPPTTVTFTGNVPAGASVTWQFGDGLTGSGATVSHIYGNRGIDTIRMFVYDPHTGCKDTVTKVDTLYDLNFSMGNFPMTGCAPDTTFFYSTTFTDEPPDTTMPKTYPFPISYTWNFGDGSASTLATPTHIYTAAGTYSANFEEVTANGCMETDTFSMSIGAPPVAIFTATPTHVCYGDTIYYTGIATTGPVSFYKWAFGDGIYGGTYIDTPTNKSDYIDSIVYIDNLPGVFTVTVTPYYNGCAGAPYIGPQTIRVDSPKSVISIKIFCPPSTAVQFGDSSLGDSRHLWIFGDGDTTSAKNPLHVYAGTGPYIVKLATYNTSSGCRDTSQNTIVFSPKISFSISTPDSTICKGDTITISSTVTSGAPSYYYWYRDGIYKINQSAYIDAYDIPGDHTIMLILQDANGCADTVTHANYIHVSKPVVNFTASSLSGCSPLSVTYTDNSRDTAGASVTNFLWSFGDGATAFVSSPTRSVTHSYSVAGAYYNIHEIVTDNVGCKDTSKTDTVMVYPHPTAVFRGGNTHPCIGAPVTFLNTSSGASRYTWTFGDGSAPVTTASPTHTYSAPGIYNVTLADTNSHNCGAFADSLGYISVPVAPVASFYMNDSFTICGSLTVIFTNTSTSGTAYTWTFGDGGPTSAAPDPTKYYTGTGEYTVTLTASDAYGCKDSAKSHVTLFGYAGGFSYTPDSGCVPFRVYFSAANINGLPNIKWDFRDGVIDSDFYSDSTSHVYRTPGVYPPPRLILNDDTTCVSTSEGIDSIVAMGVPVVPAIGARDSVCAGDTIHLADATSGGLWRSSAPITAVVGSATGILTGMAAGSAVITYSVTNVCGATDTSILITVDPQPDKGTIAAPDVCLGLSVSLYDTARGGVWSSDNDSVAMVAGNIATGIKPGTVIINYVVRNSCNTDTATHLLTVNPLPDAGSVTGRSLVCKGDTLTLSDTVAGRWGLNALWSGIADVDSVTGLVTGLSAGTAIITYTTRPDTNGCINTATFRVAIAKPFILTGDASPVTCYGYNNGSITAAVTGNIGIPVYRWSNGDSVAAIASLAPRLYTLDVKDDSTNCAAEDSFLVTQPDSLQVTADIEKDTCNEGNGTISTTVTGGTPSYAFLWSNNATGQNIRGLLSGPYTLTVTDINKCETHFAAMVEDTCNDIIIPDVITPDGDGINDLWVITGLGDYPDNTVQIFDKWGTLLYEQAGYKNDWNGRSDKGTQMPDGTYFYLVKLNAKNATGGKNAFTGAILIKR